MNDAEFQLYNEWRNSYLLRLRTKIRGITLMKRFSKLLLSVALSLTFFVPGLADTPKLHIRLKNGTPIEERKKEQIERLAKQYDL